MLPGVWSMNLEQRFALCSQLASWRLKFVYQLLVWRLFRWKFHLMSWLTVEMFWLLPFFFSFLLLPLSKEWWSRIKIVISPQYNFVWTSTSTSQLYLSKLALTGNPSGRPKERKCWFFKFILLLWRQPILAMLNFPIGFCGIMRLYENKYSLLGKVEGQVMTVLGYERTRPWAFFGNVQEGSVKQWWLGPSLKSRCEDRGFLLRLWKVWADLYLFCPYSHSVSSNL